jgi:hypothetical protein
MTGRGNLYPVQVRPDRPLIANGKTWFNEVKATGIRSDIHRNRFNIGFTARKGAYSPDIEDLQA